MVKNRKTVYSVIFDSLKLRIAISERVNSSLPLNLQLKFCLFITFYYFSPIKICGKVCTFQKTPYICVYFSLLMCLCVYPIYNVSEAAQHVTWI